MTVQLFRTLDDGEINFEHNAHAVVHGLLHESPLSGGSAVTLFDAFATSLSFTQDGATATLVANRAYVGDRHLESSQDSFRIWEATLSGLDSWMNLSALSRRLDSASGFVSIKSDAVRASVTIEGATVEFIASGFVHYSADEISFRNRRRVAFNLERPCTPDEVSRAFLVPLRNLLCLATGKEQHIESCSMVAGSGEPWPETIHDLMLWESRFDTRSSARVLNPRIPWPATIQGLQELAARWWDLTSKHRQTIDFAFALLSDPPRYIEIRFAAASLAMERLVKHFASGDAVGFVQSLGSGVDSAVGTARAFVSRWEQARDDASNQSLGASRLVNLTHVLLELVRIGLLAQLQVDLEPSTTSPEFRHWTSRLRAEA